MLNISGYDKYSYLFELFSEISAIPRGSGNTDGIVEYLVNFAKARGLEYQRDAKNNVIIRKPATAGYEDAPAVILQGHSDIVAEKTNDCKIDMSREGLDLYVDGDFIKARGTTLGADDGVAMVYALARLTLLSRLSSPPMRRSVLSALRLLTDRRSAADFSSTLTPTARESSPLVVPAAWRSQYRSPQAVRSTVAVQCAWRYRDLPADTAVWTLTEGARMRRS